MRNFAVAHFGRSNAGPNLLAEATKHLDELVTVSGVLFSSDVLELKQIASLDVPKLTIPTYKSKFDFGIGLLLLPYSIFRIIKFLKSNSITTLVFVMPHIWDPIILPVLRISLKIEIICWIHDGKRHPGESYFSHTIVKKANLYCANSLVTFSTHVEQIVRKQTKKKLITLILPKNEILENSVSEPGEVLFIGRINAYKGLNRLEFAWRIIEKQMPGLHLTIAGNGPIRYVESLGKNLDNCTLILRNLKISEFDNLLKQASLIVIPYDEASQSGIIIKAVEFKVPYVVTPVRGLIEQAKLHGGATIASDMGAASFANSVLMSLRNGPEISWQENENLTWKSQMQKFVSCLEILD